jgi:hypothetical protein
MAPAHALQDLYIEDLPPGDFAYVREVDGSYSLRVYAPGTVELVAIVATGMDKLHCAIIAQALNALRKQQSKQ